MLADFVTTTQRSFHVNSTELATLFPLAGEDTVQLALALFDAKSTGVVDSCELLSSLVLAAPHLSRDAKQKAIFDMFNFSTHRVGLLVADEATLLFRTVTIGTAKLVADAASAGVGGSGEAVVPTFSELAFFENLTKTLYGEEETLTYDEFSRLCQETADVYAFIAQWPHAGEQVEAA